MGNAFEDEMRTSLKNTPDIWFTKLYDDSRHFLTRPFDYLVLGINMNAAIECKSVQGKSLPFTNVPEHQENGLLEFKDRLICNTAFIAVNFRNAKQKRNRAFLIDINTYLGYKRTATRKSLPIDWCEENARELLRTKFKQGSYGWEMKDLLL